MRAYLLALALLLLIIGGIAGYVHRQFSALARTDFSPPPITIAAATSRSAVWPSELEAVGTIRATRGVELSAETSGEIIAIHVSSGEMVKAGQLVLTLNDSVENASVSQAEANLTLARQLHERDTRLLQQKSIPQSQFDRSRADLDSAIAMLAEARAQLENRRIVAPFDGTTGIIRVKVGDYIESGTSITSLQDLTELEIDFSVPERYVASLRPGLTMAVGVAAYPGRPFSASLTAVDARVNSDSRNLLLRARLEDGDGLLPGMFARIVLDLDQPLRVVTVPESAVAYSLHGNTVYVITQSLGGTTVQPRVVTTGATREGMTEVRSGLLSGEWIVTAGQNKLYRDARVTIDESVKF